MFTQPANLATHYLEAMRDTANPHGKHLRLLRAIDGPALAQVAAWIAVASKFFLPSGGYVVPDLVTPRPMLATEDIDCLVLPSPVTLLEYRIGVDSLTERNLTSSIWQQSGDRRITLAIEISSATQSDEVSSRTSCFAEVFEPELLHLLDREGGLLILALWFDDEEDAWSIGMGSMVVPRSQELPGLVAPERRVLGVAAKRPSSSENVALLHVFVPALIGSYARLAGAHGHVAAQESMRNDVLSDACILADFLRAYHCKNVDAKTIPAFGGEKLGRKRDKEGRFPFFPYQVLVRTDSEGQQWLGRGRVIALGTNRVFAQVEIASAA